MRNLRLACLAGAFAALLAFPACGGPSTGDDDGDDGDDTAEPDASIPSDFTELIGRDWTIPTGETYKCVRIRIEEDMWVNGFHVLSPLGTHHTVLTISTASTPLGDYDCSAGSLDFQMLFASGVATDDLVFPEGVAMHLVAGQYINLNLHLFNTQPSGDLSGRTAIFVKAIDAGAVEHEAGMHFGGETSFTIPGETGDTPYHVHGECSVGQGVTLLAYWPHMHQYATHQKVTLTQGGVDNVVHDEEYSFYEQTNYPFATPVVLQSGDKIAVDCYYENHTGVEVGFGDSSNKEMCFTGIYQYPKPSNIFECSGFPGG